jgi:hypothetical protein
MKKQLLYIAVFIFISLLSGCMYPDDMRGENKVSPQEYIVVVQNAVDRYRQDKKVLPIKNSDSSTPVYEKYVIDFKKLQDFGYLSRIPANAFEKGGTDYYVLIDVENDPKVRLMDIVTIQKVGEVQNQVYRYMRENNAGIPAGERIMEGFYRIDNELLNLKATQIKSMYSQQYLGLVLHQSGTVAVDYAPEIMKWITREGLTNIDANQDLRAYLAKNSFYVPARSFPYYWREGEPVISFQ